MFIGNAFAGQQSGFVWRITTFGMSFLLHIVGAIMAWTVLQTLASHIRWQDSKVFHTLSSYSMAMYLFHQQIIYFTISALNGVVNPWINAGVNFVAAIAGSTYNQCRSDEMEGHKISNWGKGLIFLPTTNCFESKSQSKKCLRRWE